MNHTELLRWNKQGLIPGPLENEKDFIQRVDFCLSLRDQLKEDDLPSDRKEGSQDFLEHPLKMTEENFDVRPDWVPLFFSNWQLFPWHGGSAWIFQCEKEGPLGSVLQLRKAFFSKERYLGIYDRSELIAHEMAHACRMAFNEKKYEEMFAYKTSKKGLASLMGPILQSSFESKGFVFLLATLLMMDLFLIFAGSWDVYFTLLPLKVLPILLILYGAFRLWKKKQSLQQAESLLAKLVGPQKARFVLFRLKDDEIELFSKKSPEEILTYIRSDHSPRMQMIQAAYF